METETTQNIPSLYLEVTIVIILQNPKFILR